MIISLYEALNYSSLRGAERRSNPQLLVIIRGVASSHLSSTLLFVPRNDGLPLRKSQSELTTTARKISQRNTSSMFLHHLRNITQTQTISLHIMTIIGRNPEKFLKHFIEISFGNSRTVIR